MNAWKVRCSTRSLAALIPLNRNSVPPSSAVAREHPKQRRSSRWKPQKPSAKNATDVSFRAVRGSVRSVASWGNEKYSACGFGNLGIPAQKDGVNQGTAKGPFSRNQKKPSSRWGRK